MQQKGENKPGRAGQAEPARSVRAESLKRMKGDEEGREFS